jgi:hypothetical protein
MSNTADDVTWKMHDTMSAHRVVYSVSSLNLRGVRSVINTLFIVQSVFQIIIPVIKNTNEIN